MKKKGSLTGEQLREYKVLLDGFKKDFKDGEKCARELSQINDTIRQLESRRVDLMKDFETRNEKIRNELNELSRKLLSHPEVKEKYLTMVSDTREQFPVYKK
jgi:chromosome segregation ATPase